jgi:glycosyltransferase involved in cell wall biosynthesis
MVVWVVNRGEQLPIDEGNPRLMRLGILSEMLVERGHRVVWWSSVFSHRLKKMRCAQEKETDINPSYKIVLLQSFGYSKNLALSRIVDNYILASSLKKAFLTKQKPDIIISSVPTIEMSRVATDYGKLHGVPVVIDLRDKWPDSIVDMLPNGMRFLGKIALYKMYRDMRSVCKDAYAIFGITDGFLDWGLEYSGRIRSSLDRVFHHSYNPRVPEIEELEKAKNFWHVMGIEEDKTSFIACYFGVLGSQAELSTVIDSARILGKLDISIRFVLCGTGDYENRFRQQARRLDNVIFPGFIGWPEIWTLMQMSSVGLVPLKSNLNFIENIPNKPVEYLSAGLPIVSSLKGTLADLLAEHQCGITYPNNDAESLTQALVSLWENPGQLRLMSENSRKLFNDRFSADKVLGDMINCLEQIVANWDRSANRMRRDS